MKDYVLVLTTCPENEADTLAQILVASKKCACVNILPKVQSIYHWKGEIEKGKESLLLMKTEKALTDKLWEVIKINHSYDVPEFVIIPILGGSDTYLSWISESVRDDSD
ncbi:MAG: divalent cation tolerance protein CutA [Candidatus Lokiarchaeota archaeon]|nr:divalent cation tolerance protein CutA [Candidatus Lokiarchaeota archaeon]